MEWKWSLVTLVLSVIEERLVIESSLCWCSAGWNMPHAIAGGRISNEYANCGPLWVHLVRQEA